MISAAARNLRIATSPSVMTRLVWPSKADRVPNVAAVPPEIIPVLRKERLLVGLLEPLVVSLIGPSFLVCLFSETQISRVAIAKRIRKFIRRAEVLFRLVNNLILVIDLRVLSHI